jgi:hypothetical protein
MAEPPTESARRALRQTIRESTSVAINLASQEIGDAGAIEIARALADPPVDAKDPFNNNLQGLNLAHNEIGDVGVTALSTALTRYDKLKVLDLQDNKIGDVGAKVHLHSDRPVPNHFFFSSSNAPPPRRFFLA